MKSASSGRSSLPYGEGRSAPLASAVKIVAERGLRGITLPAVAEDAVVDSALIVHRFGGGRDQLLTAALQWVCDHAIEVSKLASYPHGNAHTLELLETLRTEPESHIFQMEMILEARRRPELQPTIRRLCEHYLAVLGASLGGAGGSDALTRVVFASLDGLVLQFLGGTIDADELVEAVPALRSVSASAFSPAWQA